MNNVFNIVRQENYHAFKVRLQRLEESLYNAPSCENTLQEIVLRKTRVATLEPARTKRDESLQLKDQRKSKKHHSSSQPWWRQEQPYTFPSSSKNSSGNSATIDLVIRRILESKIPKYMEKTPKLSDYDGKGDLDEHMQLVDDRFSYFGVDDASKCKLFALALVGPACLWFYGLPDKCNNSWTKFQKIFYA